MPKSPGFLIGYAALSFLSFATPCSAEQPSAIVEDIQAPGAGLLQFDYVTPGQVIDLGSDGTLTLGYLASCQRERIAGGRVTVGEVQSSVEGGDVKRLKVPCSSGSIQLTEQTVQQSAVAAFRAYDPTTGKGFPAPQAVLYGTSPLVKLPKPGGVLEIHRIDSPEQPIEVPMDRAVEDLGRLGISLSPGGLYQATAQGRGITFKVDPTASASGSILSRLLYF